MSKQRHHLEPGAAVVGQPSYWVGPLAAVRCGFRNYGTFHGRAGRREFWWWALFNAAGLLVCGLSVLIIGLATSDQDGNSQSRLLFIPLVPGGLFVLSTVVPNISITIRRLHDTGSSGYLDLLNLIPYIGGIIVLTLCLPRSSPLGLRFDRLHPGQASVLPPTGFPHLGPVGPAYPTQPYPSAPYQGYSEPNAPDQYFRGP